MMGKLLFAFKLISNSFSNVVDEKGMKIYIFMKKVEKNLWKNSKEHLFERVYRIINDVK
jgi:hypothetical protein